jgi:hypothetical protein
MSLLNDENGNLLMDFHNILVRYRSGFSQGIKSRLVVPIFDEVESSKNKIYFKCESVSDGNNKAMQDIYSDICNVVHFIRYYH